MIAADDDMDDLLLVGRVARPHGNRGQVIVNPETDFPDERFRVGAGAAGRPGGAAGDGEIRDGPVSPGPADHRRSTGVETMNDAEALAGAELWCRQRALAPLPAGTFYHHDLIGCEVATRADALIGRVTGGRRDDRAQPPGRRRRHGEVLIPLVDGICVEVDIAARRIVVDPPEGLLDRRTDGLELQAHDGHGPTVKIDIVTIFPEMVRGAARGGDRRPRDRAGAARRAGARPARSHDRPAPGRRRHAVWRRARDGAEAGAAVPGRRRTSGRSGERRRRSC